MTIPFTDPIEDVRQLWRSGESKRIDACLLMVANSCPVVEVSQRLGLDTDTVGKMVQAGKQYRAIMELDEDLACDIRRELTYSHLSLIYRYVSVAGILTVGQGTEYLIEAIWERLSVRKLDAKIRVEQQLIIEPEYVETVRRYIKHLDRDLINTPMAVGSSQAQDFAAKQVRPAAENLLELLQELEGMIVADEAGEIIGV